MVSDVFHHPWLGGLFADHETAALLSPERQLEQMRLFEAEYLRAQAALGLVPAALADRAVGAILSAPLDQTALAAGAGADGVVVPAFVRQLRDAAGPEAAEVIHRGLTSQDVIDTALVLTLKQVVALFAARLEELEAKLAELSATYGDRPLMGRTRMQAALPVTVADRLATWQQPLPVHRQRLAELSSRLLRVQFGGAVGTRSASGADGGAIAARLAAALGLGNPPRAWHAMRDPLAEFAGWLSLVSGTLGKMGQDVALMSQQGLDEIALSGGGGSSAMPHKQNPVAAEVLVALARFNATLLPGLHHAMIHEQERSGAAWTLEWMLLPQMVLATGRALTLAQGLADRIVSVGTPGA